MTPTTTDITKVTLKAKKKVPDVVFIIYVATAQCLKMTQKVSYQHSITSEASYVKAKNQLQNLQCQLLPFFWRENSNETFSGYLQTLCTVSNYSLTYLVTKVLEWKDQKK